MRPSLSPRATFVLAMLSVLLAGAGRVLACDPDHQWEPERTVTRRVLSRAAMAAVGKDIATIQSDAAGRKVAVLSVSDDFAREGLSPDGIQLLSATRRAQQERLAARELAAGLTRAGVAAIGPDEVEPILVEEKVPRGLWTSAMAMQAIARRLGVHLFVRATLVDYGQIVHVFRDVRAANVGLRMINTYDYVRCRAAVQDDQGRYVLLREAQGQTSDGALLFARGDPPRAIDRFVEYKVEQPRAAPIRYPATLRHLDS